MRTVVRRSWTRSPEARRGQLLEAAMALFADKGHGVTVAEITHAAGVSKGTFYVYFSSKTELISELREMMIADYQSRTTKAIADRAPVGSALALSRELVEGSIDFLSSELHSILFPSAADQARGQREVVQGFEEVLIDANRKGVTDVPDPYWFAVLLVGAANFAVRYSLEAQTFDRDALVDAILELHRRALGS
jgi:AcrR family transcriptional regulator